jgi:uncharacterized membrane protein
MSAVRLQWVLSRGPPWARGAGESNQQLQLLVLGLAVAVLILFVAVVLLWRRRPGGEQPSPGETSDIAAEEPDEYEQIRRIDSTVDGRLPQQEIVRQTDWSEAKVSRVVSRLADEGQLEKVRVGRRNFIQVGDDDESGSTEQGVRDSVSP